MAVQRRALHLTALVLSCTAAAALAAERYRRAC